MKKLLWQLHVDKKLLFQWALVVAVFTIMVLISNMFGSYIVNRNMRSYGDEVINSSVEALNAYLNESKLTLNDIVFSIEKLKKLNADKETMLDEMVSWTDQLINNDIRFEAFVSVYGVVDGAFIDGSNWIPPAEYVPESRPWYIGAIEKRNDIFYADPYIDARTGEYILTVSRQVFDKNGKSFGVIAIDMYISGISDFVENLKLLDSGYGVLLDSELKVIIHPEDTFITKRLADLRDITADYSEVAGQLAVGDELSALAIKDFNGTDSVVFFKTLFNGWKVGIISPSRAYYNNVFSIIVVLSISGFVLMLVLCVVLAALRAEKNRTEEAGKSKTSLLAKMSHEIRTPLNSIIGMSELLLNESLTNRQKGYVNDIYTSSNSLLTVINDVLDLSKIESGNLELNPVNYDFHMFLDNTFAAFKFVTQKKGIEFRHEVTGQIPDCLFGDDFRLGQVLSNICENAVKFTSSGYIRLRLNITEQALVFEIKDTGIGVRREDLHKLFDPLSQSDLLKSRNVVGTGLGLPISKTIVDMMNGTIEVDSVYGQGTVFTVTIPKVIGDANAITYEPKEEKVFNLYAPAAKILVVDDNDVNLKVAVGLLKLYGISATKALSGDEAIKAVQSVDYDIVFMDHMMPGMDGVEATKAIRNLGGRCKHLTIIALTANVVLGAKEMYLANGFNDFLSKPIDVSELAAMLKEWLPTSLIMEKTDGQDANAEKATPISFLDYAKRIKIINTEIGMNNVSGVEDMYRETTELFVKKIPAECGKLNRYLRNSDLKNLETTMQGIKSSLAAIGAISLSETANELETAAKKDNISYCEEHLPGFIEKMRSIYEEMSVFFQKEGTPNTNL